MKKACAWLAALLLIGSAALFASAASAPTAAQSTSTAFAAADAAEAANAAQTAVSSGPTFQPKVIVSKTSVDPSPAVAGQEFTATVTLKNTSGTEAVRDMTVTASCNSTNVTLENDSDTLYIDTLDSGQTKDIQFKYKTDLNTPAQPFSISLAISYASAEGAALTAAGVVPVLVSQPLNVAMDAPQISSQVTAGDTIPLTFHVMNMGRSAVYNVRCELSAPGLVPSGTAYIGNMNAGTSAQGTMDVFIGTKTSGSGTGSNSSGGTSSGAGSGTGGGATASDLYGLTSGKITLTYEDETGKAYTKDVEFSTTINQPVAGTSTASKAAPQKAGQWWASLLIGGAMVAVLAVVLAVRWKKEQHHEDR